MTDDLATGRTEVVRVTLRRPYPQGSFRLRRVATRPVKKLITRGARVDRADHDDAGRVIE